MVLSSVMVLYNLRTFSWGSCRWRQTDVGQLGPERRRARGLGRGGTGARAASYVRILAGVDDLALPVHDTVDGDSRDDIGLDEF